MNIKEERLQWKHDAQNIERHIDGLIKLMKSSNAVPVAYMGVDMIYGPYLQWLQSAQALDVDATMTRNSAVNFISMMVIEMCRRMNRMDGDMKDALEWVDNFMEMVNSEVDKDLNTLMNYHGTPSA